MDLYDYQKRDVNRIIEALTRGGNILYSLATGGGKTVIMSHLLKLLNAPTCIIAHREELLIQLSITLAKNRVYHRIIAPKKVIKLCVKFHMQEFDKSYYDPSNKIGIAGVDTIIRRKEALGDWCASRKYWFIDEGHHVLRDNKWGEAVDMFPNAQGLGFTATPCRSDKKGLGVDFSGVYHELIDGPQSAELIRRGFLCKYRVICANSHIDLHNVKVGSTGDYVQPQLVKAMRKSKIVGDVVDSYRKYSMDKKAIVFATDVPTAKDMAQRYNDMGIPAASIDAKTPGEIRALLLYQFKQGKLLVLVNVDIFGEGFDLPDIYCVIFARPTRSLGLYRQQAGRGLRTSPGKSGALLIDHVGNILLRHGLPDIDKVWSLDGKVVNKNREDDLPLRTCLGCMLPYPRILKICPYCQTPLKIEERGTIEQVEGDLIELSPEVLEQLRNNVKKIDRTKEEYAQDLRNKFVPELYIKHNVKGHLRDQIAQSFLRSSIANWAGVYRARGDDNSTLHRRFYFVFGLDVLTACALKKHDAIELNKKICAELK